MFLRGTLFILNVVGLSPLETGIFSKIRLVTYCLSFAFFSMGIIGGGIQTFEGLNTWIRWSNILPGLIQTTGKTIVLLSRRQELAEALRLVSGFWKSDILINELKSEVNIIPTSVAKGLKMFYILGIVVYVQFYSSPLLQGSPQLPIIFMMEGIQPYHNYIYMFETAFALPCVMATIAFEGLFIYYIASVIQEYRTIRYIFDGKTIDSISFVDNVKHHSFLIRFVKKMSDIYQYILMTMMATTFCYICFGLFVITQKGITLSSLEDLSKYGGLFCGSSLQIAMYCFIGQLLVDESVEIADTLFYKDWLELRPYQNPAGRMMVMRMSQKGQGLSVGGFFPLDLVTYTWMMRNVVSFITFMQTLSAEI